MRLVVGMPGYGPGVNGFPHLRFAGGTNVSSIFVEIQTVRVPIEATKVDNPARPWFQIGDNTFIRDFEHRLVEDRLPMRHKLLIFNIMLAESR